MWLILVRELLIFCFTGQASMALNPLTNESTSAERNVVKLEEFEENPVTEEITLRRSSASDD